MAKKKQVTMPSAISVRFDKGVHRLLLSAGARAKFFDGKISWGIRAIVMAWLAGLKDRSVDAVADAMDAAYLESRERELRAWAERLVTAAEERAPEDGPTGQPGTRAAGGRKHARGA
ncbi:MAG TPA: hypothetical protein PKC49_11300 [Phycisphaerae bacterium]|nr:hypothetical protein [Phycisphaerae bacterium]